MEEYILICPDTMEGIFTAIYEAYEKHLPIEQTSIQTEECGDIRLFARYEIITPKVEKSSKVIRTLKRRFGMEAFWIFCQALASVRPQKATVVFHTIAKGLKLKYPSSVLRWQADEDVRQVLDLKINVWHEMHHFWGFLRFRELQSGILYAEFEPKNNVLLFVADHFSDRLPMDRFVIRDLSHSIIAIHEAGKECFYVKDMGIDDDKLMESVSEAEYQMLFRHFHQKIAIKERENTDLQKNMLPLRFRPYMTEFTSG